MGDRMPVPQKHHIKDKEKEEKGIELEVCSHFKRRRFIIVQEKWIYHKNWEQEMILEWF